MATSYDPIYNPNGLTVGLFYSKKSGYCDNNPSCTSPTTFLPKGNSYVVWIFDRENKTFFDSNGLFSSYNPANQNLLDPIEGTCDTSLSPNGDNVVDCYGSLKGTQYFINCDGDGDPSPIGTSRENVQISIDITHKSITGNENESSVLIWIRNNAGIGYSSCGSTNTGKKDGVYLRSTKMPVVIDPNINNYNLCSPNNQIYVFSTWGNLGYGGDQLTWSDYSNVNSGDRRVIQPKFYFDYISNDPELDYCEIGIVHYVDYVNITYVASIVACASSICGSGVSECVRDISITNRGLNMVDINMFKSNKKSKQFNAFRPLTEMNNFMRRAVSQLSQRNLTNNPGTLCNCRTTPSCPTSGNEDANGIYGDRIIFTGTFAPNTSTCVGESEQDCACECRRLVSLIYPSYTTSGSNKKYDVSSFSIYPRQTSCMGAGCEGYSEEWQANDNTLCGGLLGTRILYTYKNESDIKNGTNNLVTSNYGVRYMFGGTDYNMYGNVNGFKAPRSLVTNITDTSPNNGMYVYNDRICS